MEGKLLGFDYDLLVTMIGLMVAGMAAIIGIWVERDSKRPARYAIWLSVLITMATGVGMFQTYDDDQDQKKVEGDLARVLQRLDKIATENDIEIPELNELIQSELAAQSRANPNVVAQFAQRVSDEGDDPGEVVGAYLPASEVENIQRKGTFKPKPKAAAPEARANETAKEGGGETATVANPEVRKERRKRLSFGGGPPKPMARSGEDAKAAKIEEPKKVEKPEKPEEPSESASNDKAKDRDATDAKDREAKDGAKVRLRPGAEPEKPPAAADRNPRPALRPTAPPPRSGPPVRR